MLNSLFGTAKEKNLYISVSPSAGLEVLEIDSQGEIKSYAQAPLVYDETQRKIHDYGEFKLALQELFSARNINPARASIHLNMPLVWFGYKDALPLMLNDNAITQVVLGELEQSFIFKREEPIPVWFDDFQSTNSDSRSVFYSAIQAGVIGELKAVFASFNATLTSVTCSLTSTLKGLCSTGVAAKYMGDDSCSWYLMIINNNGYQMFSMLGKRLVEYFDEPIPIRSFEQEEVYSEIENPLQLALMGVPAQALVIVSESDLVSAEILAEKCKMLEEVVPLENNVFKKNPIAEMSLNVFAEDQMKVSLNAFGLIKRDELLPEGLRIDFLSNKKSLSNDESFNINFGNSEYVLTPPKATVLAIIFLIIVAIIMGVPYLFFNQAITSYSQKKEQIENDIRALEEEEAKYKDSSENSSFNPSTEIEKVLKNNRTKIMNYTSIGESIPENLYITYFMTGGDGMIDVRGCASSVEDVYVFFKNLKESLADSSLRLSKLDLIETNIDDFIINTTSALDDSPYIFEITNMDDGQLTAFTNKLLGKEEPKNDENADKKPEPGATDQPPVSEDKSKK